MNGTFSFTDELTLPNEIIPLSDSSGKHGFEDLNTYIKYITTKSRNDFCIASLTHKTHIHTTNPN